MTELYPGWKEAVRAVSELVDSSDTGEVLLTHKWLHDTMRLQMPTPSTPHAQATKMQWTYLAHVQRMEKALLRDHQIALRSEKSVGYMTLRPTEQTPHAMRELKQGLAKLIRDTHETVTNVRTHALSDGEKTENHNAQARVAALRQMTKEPRRLGT